MKPLLIFATVAACAFLGALPTLAQSNPTTQETAGFIRGKLLSLGAPINSGLAYQNVDAPGSGCAMRLALTDNSEMLVVFGSLDSAALAWEVYDPAANAHSGEKLLMLTVVSARDNALSRRTFQPIRDSKQPTYQFVFSLAKAADTPGFKDRMTEAVKHLIQLCATDSLTTGAVHSQPAFDPATGPDLTGTWVKYPGQPLSKTYKVTRDGPGRFTFLQIVAEDPDGFDIHWDGNGHFVFDNAYVQGHRSPAFKAAFSAKCGFAPPRNTTIGELSPDGTSLTLHNKSIDDSADDSVPSCKFSIFYDDEYHRQ